MKRFTAMMAVLIIYFILGYLFPFSAMEVQASEVGIVIDGYSDDWSDKPYSWEYSQDNSYIDKKYWDGTEYIVKEYRDENGDPYNLDIRHKMSLYTDGEYVYLHIVISSKAEAGMQGDNFQFWIDGEMADFNVTYVGGDKINKNDNKIEPGIYTAEVRHRTGTINKTVVEDAQAVFTKKVDDLNNELEVKIPLAAMKLQNNEIQPDSARTIEFFVQDLMYRRIACSGVSTGPIIGIILSAAVVGGVLYWNKRRTVMKQV